MKLLLATIATTLLAAASANNVENIVVEKSADGRKLKVQFEAFDQTHVHEELHLVQSDQIYHPDMHILVKGAENTELPRPQSQTYKKHSHKGWTIVTLSKHTDGNHNIRATHVGMDDVMLSVEHSDGVHRAERRHLEEAVDSLEQSCQVFEVNPEGHGSTDGTVFTDTRLKPQILGDRRNLRNGDQPHTHHDGINLSVRSLRARPKRWGTDCFDNTSPRYFDLGFIVDLTLYKKFGSMEATVAEVESMFSHAQHVFFWQVNILLRLAQLVVVTAPIENAKAGSPDFFLAELTEYTESELSGEMEYRCPTAITSKLTAINILSKDAAKRPVAEANGHMVQLGEWHWLTNCYPIPGIVGVAVRFPTPADQTTAMCAGDGQLVTSGMNSGVSSHIGAGAWLVFTHELGHNWGLAHSFENGQSQTTGIMDYGDYIHYEKQIQFNDEMRHTEFCANINFLLSSQKCQKSWGSDFFGTYSLDGLCAEQDDGTPCLIGYCEAKVCIPIETGLWIDDVPEEFIEEIQVGWIPSNYRPNTKTVTGIVAVANPPGACSELDGDFENKWVMVNYDTRNSGGRSECSIDERIKWVDTANAAGAIFFNQTAPDKQDLKMFRAYDEVDIPVIEIMGKTGAVVLGKINNQLEVTMKYGRLHAELGDAAHQIMPKETVRKGTEPPSTPPSVSIPPTISASSPVVSSLLMMTVMALVALF